jgi:hypothetical protein
MGCGEQEMETAAGSKQAECVKRRIESLTLDASFTLPPNSSLCRITCSTEFRKIA